MRKLFAIALCALPLAACQETAENYAIDSQYVGADMTKNRKSPIKSAVASTLAASKGKHQARCAVVRYDEYARPYCDTVKFIR
jgi:uncharacterized protein YcfL